ncbi:phenylacetic acid degradation protein [Gemmobacter caeni]|uniref:Phenylacetic acid degradation protein n=2 Tax=Gemmobacter TaxID=204456 RepID=A0A2T6B6C4_9RHOB|nr:MULTISPECIES: transferase hexapeptide repeat family protein [Gemmobacter]PTX51631.1 phenylacetic acid degradation protein [Gemmobacter caeni]TWJ03759.1 phenylacetic acid degradation protein [Gemmobacter caeni]GHC12388.1 phenylacetic acid degradation protein PaaY [Gemmobacter nanjingensis]
MSRVYAYDGVVPVIDPMAFVHPEAVVIGDVIIGPAVYVGPGAVLRGDFGRIVLERGCNVQETCVVHSFPGKDVVVEESGHIGHGAVLHGCQIGRNAMVGMNAVVMDEAVVGENTIIAAMAFVKAGAQIPPNSLAVGSPAKVVRELSPEEIAWKRQGTGVYQRLALEARDKLRPAVALTEAEPDRRRTTAPEYDPLVLARAGFEG